jgi:hypothetical protein
MVAVSKTLKAKLRDVQDKQLDSLAVEPVDCGDDSIDIVARLIFEARKTLVLGQTVNTLAALNVAMDVISTVQQEVRTAIAQSEQGGEVANEQNPTDDRGQA